MLEFHGNNMTHTHTKDDNAMRGEKGSCGGDEEAWISVVVIHV